MWLIGSIFIHIISGGNAQYWDGCTGVRFTQDGHVNCLSTSSESKVRCFCLHEHSDVDGPQKWLNYYRDCGRKYDGGRLAVDDSLRVHKILSKHVASQNTGAWIGARTLSAYWNWLPTLENTWRKRMSYQGCYAVKDNSQAESTTLYADDNNLRQVCNSHCSKNKTSYYTLEKYLQQGYLCSCYNGDKFNLTSYGAGHCLRCDQKGGYRDWCGRTQQDTKAVYLVDTEAKYINWKYGHPSPMNYFNKCLLFKNEWESSTCDTSAVITDIIYCSKGNASSCQSASNEWTGPRSGLCFRRIKRPSSISYKQAVKLCHGINMSLVSILSGTVQQEISNKWNSEEQTYRKGLWVAGTNLRWQWITGTDVADGFTSWLNTREQFAFENMCLTVSSTGHWISDLCSREKPYLCETVIDSADVVFPSTTSMPVTTGLNYSGTDSTSQTQAGRIVGAVVGGCLLLLILVLILFFLLRYRRHRNEAGQTMVKNLEKRKGNINASFQADSYGTPNKYATSNCSSKSDKNMKYSYVNRVNAKFSNLVNTSTTDGNPHESSLSSILEKNGNSKIVHEVDNELYNSSAPDEHVYCIIDDKDMNSNETLNTLMKTPVDSEICAVGETPIHMPFSDIQYYNLTEADPMGENKSMEAAMIENDIYFSTEDNTNNLKSADIMVDNIIYNSSDDETTNESSEVGTPGRPHDGTPKPRETGPPTADYELASPISQVNTK